ncbi:DUF6891 domain-containing protein [Chitinilyticum piscinae]|uniref:DUF6891 domain-containing protein n=1 Tax=Chitinilyticum piscinae TaxID=2866724 RepID=A0A8J7FFN1_9NEIS|nr:hypothetical protein [Chitinilyticum piscinae]MBE9608140.1 hypothetical protein [Chitinilyticum piscinae]
MNETSYVHDTLGKWIWSACYGHAELHGMLDDLLDDEGIADADSYHGWLDSELQRKQQDEAGWPAITDCDRLDAAFAELEMAGICCLHNAGYTMSDGCSDAFERMDEAGAGRYRGFCFYHGQDVERALDAGGLMLAFGDTDDSPERSAVIAGEIVTAMQRAGLAADWNGSVDTRISLPQFCWQRRSQPLSSPFALVTGPAATGETTLRCFYCFNEDEVVVDEEDGERRTALAVINGLLTRIHAVGDYCGVVDAAGNTLQLIMEDNGELWIEIPRPELQGSLGRFASAAEITTIFLNLPPRFVPEAFTGFAFQSWEGDEVEMM